MSPKMLSAARAYHRMGICIIPLKVGDKKSRIKWKEFQDRKPTLKEIEMWWSQNPDDNIGIVTGKINNLTIIDTDTPEAKTKIEKYIPDSLMTPIVSTPNGTHYYFTYQKGIPNKADLFKGCDARNDGGYIVAPPSQNGTGKPYTYIVNIKQNPPAPIPEKLIAYINQLLLSRGRVEYSMGGKANYIEGTTDNHNKPQVTTEMFIYGRRDDDLFHTANCLIKGGMLEGNISQVLEKLIISWGESPDQKWINDKVKSAMNRAETRERNIAAEVRDFCETTKGHFLTTDLYNELQLTTKEQKKAGLMALIRLVDVGFIERHGGRRGSYRIVEKDFEMIELDKIEDVELFDFRLPFGLEKYIELLPKDLIVFSAPPNAGKTAVMLETLRLNMRRHQCFYFSSEMGRHNCKKRVAKHSDCKDWPFQFIDDFDNFIDIVRPDDITFIDYLTDDEGDAYKIPGMLAKIQKKLKNGLAIVALQKNPDTKKQRTDYAVGGQQTKAKPALFVTIDPDYPGAKMRIVKCKNYRDENPNGYMISFKIFQGINLIPEGIWQPEIEG